MKYRVKIEGKYFDVEIDDIQAHPIIAIVDGDAFEVWVEAQKDIKEYSQVSPQASVPTPNVASRDTSPSDNMFLIRRGVDNAANSSPTNLNRVLSPIPGVIVSVSVKPNDDVETGQELCVLEAMKMKNVIRSPHPGKIAAVYAVTGQTVRHHDPLIEYME